jgi:Sap, sulfolipid-1-addressing protein
VLAQAAGFALLAAMSPTALLVMAVFLGSDNPRRTAMLYVTGAVLMTVVMAVTVLLVLRATGLNQPRQHEPRYGLRLGLGILALAVAAVMTVRGRRQAPSAVTGGGQAGAGETGPAGAPARQPGLMSRLTARPRPLTAFLAGLLLFAPSATFIAAVQVIATADATVAATVVAMVIVAVLTVVIVWLPLIAYLAAPGATTRALRAANGWLVAHGRSVVTCGLLIAGVILVINGARGV